MPREDYQASLDALQADVHALGRDVIEQLETSLRALEQGDHEAARRVVDGDADINERYLALESECIDLLALQQPVASDLRLVAASFKILTDLERVGDLATNFGRYAQSTDPEALGDVDVSGIGTLCRDQLDAALDAYADGDAAACRTIAGRDDEIDTLCARESERVVRELVAAEAGGDAWAVERLMDDVSRLLLTVRDLERVGDHAVNIAARTYYMVEDDPELIE